MSTNESCPAIASKYWYLARVDHVLPHVYNQGAAATLHLMFDGFATTIETDLWPEGSSLPRTLCVLGYVTRNA